jgi:negative regulator of flagellin synthesis FlgM
MGRYGSYEATRIVVLENEMKIGQPSELPALVTQAKASAPAKTESGASPAASASAKSARPAGVAVTVSSQARALDKAVSSDVADVDTQKVATVKAAIQGGTYVVNAEAIADKLLSNAQEMFQRTTR